MGQRLYKRFLRLSLVNPNGNVATFSGIFFAQLPNALIIRDQRVKFHIEKNLGKHPNKATITVTNLAETTRAQFIKRPLIVRLEVGYDGEQNVHQIFSGDLRIADTVHDGPDVNTKLELGEGDRAFQFARISRAYAPGSPLLSAVKDIASSIGLDLPASITSAPELQAARFANGYTAHGPAQRELSALLTPIGFGWSMQDGKLVALRENGVLDNQAVVIREGDGMIGSPEFGQPKKAGEAAMLKVKTLIDPRIVAGCKIQLQSRDVHGLFRVEQFVNTGDTRSKDWYTEIQARQIT